MSSSLSKGISTIVLVLAVLVVAASVAFVALSSRQKSEEPESQTISQKIQEVVTGEKVGPTPTPFLFEELTIPYLRARKYESAIGELTQYQDNSIYTSHTTNYDSDGLAINGLLTIPKGEKPEAGWPAVVFVHGYIPPTSYRTTERYMDHVDFLARNGFVVFKIDLRGHGSSEGEPGGGYYSGEYVIDVLNAYAALETADFVNPDAIGMWGHSMSGNVLLRAFAAKQNISAITIWAGAGYTYSDLQEYQIDDNSYRPPPTDSEQTRKRQLLLDTYGGFDPNHWFWKQVPATNYLEGVSGAVAVHHAIDDNVVSVEYGENLMSILDKTSIAHELHKYPSGGHNITGGSFNPAMQKTVEFFRKNLKTL